MKVVIMESLGISEQELKECQKPFEEKGVELVVSQLRRSYSTASRTG